MLGVNCSRWHVLCICCCWLFAVTSATLSAQGQEPWLVVWKKGVDGQALWKTLCPSISITDDPQMMLESLAAAPGPSADSLLRASAAAELALNCGSRFSQLLNGFAGQFTLKELDTIKAVFKAHIDFVISDKPIQVDTPPAWLRDQLQGAVAANNMQPDADPSMQPKDPSAEHRRLQQQDAQAADLPVATGIRRLLPEEFNATWGLDILDQHALPLDDIYHYTYNGTGVHVYVLDTGIRTTHIEFATGSEGRGSRAAYGFDAVYNTNSTEDCHGHGTHVSAIIGGNTFGVAKNVTLHAVRVLACDGTAMVSSLLKGLEWVATHHIKPAVVHMSIEGAFSSVVNQAVEQLIRTHHVHVVVSSGNSGKDACRSSPASAPSAITVAAVDSSLARWAYANWGACVDVFAPGVAILSAVSNRGDTGTALKTGTSMAAPFVTGVVAAYLEVYPGASPEEVQQKLYQSVLRGSVVDDPQGFATLFPSSYPDLTDISSTPNRMLQANLTGQAIVKPGRVNVTAATSGPVFVSIALAQKPSGAVNVTVSTPNAWDGSPLAAVSPAELVFTPDDWGISAPVTLLPRAVCEGDYYLTFTLNGNPEDGFPAIHTVLVSDSRRRSGDTAAMARVISHLPFKDAGDTSSFTDNYGCQPMDASPDVVYSYKPPADVDITIATCGSGFDTKLLVSTNLSDPSTYTCNDDDRTCTTNTACSRLDISLKAATTYFIVVDGYSCASGEYVLAISCSKCPDEASQQASSPSPNSSGSDAPQDGSSSSTPNAALSSALIQALLHLSHPQISSPTPPSPSPAPTPVPGGNSGSRSSPATPVPAPAPTIGPGSNTGSSSPAPAAPSPAPSPAPTAAPGSTGGSSSSSSPARTTQGRTSAPGPTSGPTRNVVNTAPDFLTPDPLGLVLGHGVRVPVATNAVHAVSTDGRVANGAASLGIAEEPMLGTGSSSGNSAGPNDQPGRHLMGPGGASKAGGNTATSVSYYGDDDYEGGADVSEDADTSTTSQNEAEQMDAQYLQYA